MGGKAVDVMQGLEGLDLFLFIQIISRQKIKSKSHKINGRYLFIIRDHQIDGHMFNFVFF